MVDKTPVLFIGHGSPTNAIEDNEFSRSWEDIGRTLPKPRAILSISAHWETVGTCVTAMTKPDILYDFQGMPRPLYEFQYPAPGDPELARSIKQIESDTIIHLDFRWGLDHGTWSVLSRLFPNADIPVVQLSLDFDQPAEFHYQLGRKLKYLREQEVLVIGSGNMVHNLRAMVWKDIAFDWAKAFDAELRSHIKSGNHRVLIDYESMLNSERAIPTNEHFLPLLYVLAMQDNSDKIVFFCDKVTLGSISMRSFILL